MAVLGNLTARIVLSIFRMSTVKIRTGSLFRTRQARIGAREAGFQRAGRPGPADWGDQRAIPCGKRFPPLSTAGVTSSQDVHRRPGFQTCVNLALQCKVKTEKIWRRTWKK